MDEVEFIKGGLPVPVEPSWARVAIRKANKPGWLWYGWEAVGEDCIVRGAVPVGTKSKGKNKGKPIWPKESDKFVVTRDEQKAEDMAYEKESGNCYICYGHGKRWVGWNCDQGDKYKPCNRCNKTGKAPHA